MILTLLLLDLYFYTHTRLTTYLFLIPLTSQKDRRLTFLILLIANIFVIKSYFLFTLALISCYILNFFIKIPPVNILNFMLRFALILSFFLLLNYFVLRIYPNLGGLIITFILALFCAKNTLN